jgi:hypothetical protein
LGRYILAGKAKKPVIYTRFDEKKIIPQKNPAKIPGYLTINLIF